MCNSVLRSDGISGYIHRQVIHARYSTGIRKTMKAVPVVVDTVTFLQLVVDTIEGKIKRSLFDYHVLARTLSVGKKGAGINAGIQSRSHEFEFNARQHRREDSPLPPRRVPSHRLILRSQDVNTGFHFRGEET